MTKLVERIVCSVTGTERGTEMQLWGHWNRTGTEKDWKNGTRIWILTVAKQKAAATVNEIDLTWRERERKRERYHRDCWYRIARGWSVGYGKGLRKVWKRLWRLEKQEQDCRRRRCLSFRLQRIVTLLLIRLVLGAYFHLGIALKMHALNHACFYVKIYRYLA